MRLFERLPHLGVPRIGRSHQPKEVETSSRTEVSKLLNEARSTANEVKKTFRLNLNPFDLDYYGESLFDFFLVEKIVKQELQNPYVVWEYPHLSAAIEENLERLHVNLIKEQGIFPGRRNQEQLKTIDAPLQSMAEILINGHRYAFFDIRKYEEIAGRCQKLANEYNELVIEYQLTNLFKRDPHAIPDKVRAFVQKHPTITTGGALLGLLAIGSATIWQLKQEGTPPSKSTPTISSSATTQDGQPTPAPLVTPEPTPAPTPEIHIPDSQFIAVAEKALSQSSVGKLSLREQIKKSGGGFAVGRLEEKSSIARAGNDGLRIRVIPIASLMVPRPNDTIRSGDEVRGIAEVKTTNPDGSTDVFWLLKPPDDHKNALQLYLPEYVRIERIFPDGLEEWYVNNVQFTKPAK